VLIQLLPTELRRHPHPAPDAASRLGRSSDAGFPGTLVRLEDFELVGEIDIVWEPQLGL